MTTDLLGRPIGDAVADPAAGPRIYVTTEYDGSTIVNAVDPSGGTRPSPSTELPWAQYNWPYWKDRARTAICIRTSQPVAAAAHW